MAINFDYTTAFSRNIGWVTTQEQEELRRKKVAVGGLGGVGGSQLIVLARLRETRNSLGNSTRRGSGAHHIMGWPGPYQGKMPRR